MAERPSSDRKAVESYFKAVMRRGLALGFIDPTDKPADVFAKEVAKYFRLVAKQPKILWVTDHESKILRHARRMAEAGELHLACLLFGTWLEHWANGTLETLLARSGHSAIAPHVLRDSPFRAKIGWLLDVLEASPLARPHAKLMLELMELRNWFVHYKWAATDVDEDDPQEGRLSAVIGQFDKTIRYLGKYRSRVIFKSQQQRVANHAKKRAGREVVGRPRRTSKRTPNESS